MNKVIKTAMQEAIPPILFRCMQTVYRKLPFTRKEEDREEWGEKPPEWYDAVYAEISDYRYHYTESKYYFLWAVVVDRMVRANVRNIFDLGCGPGQFASLVYYKGFRDYYGVDISSKCIEIAEEVCGAFNYEIADVFESDLIESHDYDCMVASEFLEHVERDLDIIKRIKKGTLFFGTVPSFPNISHVRHFNSKDEVTTRYSSYFDSFRVDSFLLNEDGPVFYIIEGVKKC